MYKGNWENNQKNGKGIITYENGETYIGNFKNDKKDGYGIQKLPDSRQFDGYWKNDSIWHGIYTMKDGSSIKAEFKNRMAINDNIFII